jgi:hypothetical protein
MRKFLVLIVAALSLQLISMSPSHAADVWNLIHSEFRSPNWYCTYQLQGSTAYKMTVVPVNNFQTTFCPLQISG